MAQTHDKAVLGIDLGANSIGWTLVGYKGEDASAIIGMGVRIFEAGSEGDIEAGRDESRAVQRRQSRLRRRQTKRQSWRMLKLAGILQKHGLLPEGDAATGATRHELLVKLDNELRAAYAEKGIPLNSPEGLREFPYFLRARALDEAMAPHAFGRALYHLAQRRGFLSNRKSDRDDAELGVVKQGISELEESVRAAGARTLGEYFHRIDPVLEKRIRSRWTARSMYADEFEKLWAAQEPHIPALARPEIKREIRDAIFFQRPLKSQKGTVGMCELEPMKRRAPKALLTSQRFRILQKVNDLRMHYPDGTVVEPSPEERAKIAAHMDTVEEVTFAGLRKLLGIRKSEDVEFNLERGGEKKLKGNTTAAKLRKVFGDRWEQLSRADQNAVIGEVMGIEKAETLERRGRERWGLDPEKARELGKTNLEPGYGALSREALAKLLPLMEQGVPFKTAEDQMYGQAGGNKAALDMLPALDKSGLSIRNPVVMRCLSELRKVVNAVVRKWGKPDEIHIELAREIKKSREDRMRISKDIRKRQDARETGYALITREANIPTPRRDDIEKYLLAVECGWICPYTGKSINYGNLFGDHPQFDVEHIIPFSRCLDDSFMNKTLCYHEENRLVKRNKTPWEAYEHNCNWDDIIARVQRFTGEAARQKLERFQSRDIKDFEDFVSQKLNDTRYASKMAARYLGWLYGADYRKRILTNTGQVTAYLRDAWRLNGILGDGDRKTRDDHRHHAVDALVIALANRSAVKRLSDAAQRQHLTKGRVRGFEKLVAQPWDTFLEDTRAAVAAVIPSHRADHRVSGRLHEDTNYSRPRQDGDGKTFHVVRKPLGDTFSEGDIELIVDSAVRAAVRSHFEAHGKNSKKAFGDPANHPVLRNGKQHTPVHRVRIRRNMTAFPVGEGDGVRYVTPDSNHHMEIVERKDKKGRVYWDAVIVDRFEAAQRVRNGVPVVTRDHGPDAKLVCTIAPGDVFRIKSEDTWTYYVIRSVSKVNIQFVRITDSRLKKDITSDPGQWLKRSVDVLRTVSFEKVLISPLGEVIPAHD